MPLTDQAVKKAKPTDKPFKLTDEKGLFLLVNQAGKYWRLAYRFGGKQKTLALGVYPDVSLARAREKRDDARRHITDGIDPGEQRKAIKAQLTTNFEAVAREWYAKAYADKTKSTREKTLTRLEHDVFSVIGALPVSQIEAAYPRRNRAHRAARCAGYCKAGVQLCRARAALRRQPGLGRA